MALSAITGGGLTSAQTLRIEPGTLVVPPITAPDPFATFEIFMDGVPSPGLRSFQVTIDSFHVGELGPCVQFVSHQIDPALKTAWGGGSVDSINVQDSNSIVRWNAIGFAGPSLPTGTVRLGTFTWLAQPVSGSCPIGLQDEFEWNSTATRWGTSTNANLEFDSLRGGTWVLGRYLNVDLSVACTQTSPTTPGVFVDGQTITLECLVSNLGTESTPINTLLQAVVSTDTTVGSSDTRIGTAAEAPVLLGGGSALVRISDTPLSLTAAQTRNLCVKIDVNESDLDVAGGRLTETNETNNVECRPITILDSRKDLVVPPASIMLTPDPADPNGAFHAGLKLQVSYALLNQGIGAIRTPSYQTRVYLGPDLLSIQANPTPSSPFALCSKQQSFPAGSFQPGGAAVTQTYGLAPAGSDSCKIPFLLTPGTHVLAIQADANNNVAEVDAGGAVAPAETNNWASVPITIQAPLPPEFRIYDKETVLNDTRVDVRGPGSARAAIGVSSARNLAGYGFSVSWDPPGLVSIGDPNVPGSDPNQVAFTNFLEQGGLDQSCAVIAIDPNAGRLDVACTTSDPNGNGSGAMSEGNADILTVRFTAVLPGPGTLAISNMTARDAAGNPYSNLRTLTGTLLVDGSPNLSVRDAVPPPAAYPNAPFTTSFDIENIGFGVANPPIEVDVVVSRDASNNPTDPNSPDLLACSSRESAPIPGRSSVTKTLTACMVSEDLRPGSYTAFYQFDPLLNPSSRTTGILSFPPRVAVLRDSGGGQALETFAVPDQPSSTVGSSLARVGEYPSRSISLIRSVGRDRNWLVRLRRNRQGHGTLQIQNLPRDHGERLEVLREVRTPDAIKRILGAADIDGDGDDELILLRSRGGAGAVLDFRRIDYGQEWPELCLSAALTGPLGGRVTAVAGIQFDGDPEDEIAILDAAGSLSIFDLLLTGTLPPASPCRGVPTVIEAPAAADLVLTASDPGFSAASGRAISLCALDWQLDGVEELASLRQGGSGSQALEIVEVPPGIGGTAILLADDPEFGGVKGRARAFAITCTR